MNKTVSALEQDLQDSSNSTIIHDETQFQFKNPPKNCQNISNSTALCSHKMLY